MSTEGLLRSLLCFALILPLRAVAADPAASTDSAAVSPGDRPVIPVLQLTVQPTRFLLTRNNCLGNVLLRELQRQAVLIAAREELGIGTRDMVLREPFEVHHVAGATTLLIETRVWRGEQAQIFLARFDGKQPSAAYTLADLPVDQSQNTGRQSMAFPIDSDPLVNYPEFVTKCEQASRTTYLSALKAEDLLGDFQPRPMRWAAGASVSVDALEYLRHMDVFSQYLALRIIHGQIHDDGGSTARLSALVQAYANLGQLCGGQWSQANKVFFARALLYAQRLVIHENASPASLYVRAYSRAFAGLHAAALDDLDLAAKQSALDQRSEPPPAWVPLVRGLCEYNPVAIERSLAIGPWQNRALATYLATVVDNDGFPQAVEQEAISRALETYPGLFVLSPPVADPNDLTGPRPADEVINEIPVVLTETLKGADLPGTVRYALNRVLPGDESYRQLAQVCARLNSAVSRVPLETAEPSLGVLADLIEQQEMVALVHQAVALRNGGNSSTDLPRLLANAEPILKAHLWGPYVEALSIDGSADAARLQQTLERIKDADPGPWVDDAVGNLNAGGSEALKITQAWQTAANLSADSTAGDYTAAVAQAKKITDHSEVDYVEALRQTSPHSASLLEAWIQSVPDDRVQRDSALYQKTVDRIEREFANRPAVMLAGCNWCEARGDFDRSFKLLQQIDRIEPSTEVCDRMARIAQHLGHRNEAINYLLRGAGQTGGAYDGSVSLYERAACYLIDDHRYSDAMQCISLSADSATPRVWQLTARCYEAMGQIEDADQCMRQMAGADDASKVQYYLWARRLQRKDLKSIQTLAGNAAADKDAPLATKYFLNLAEDHDAMAMNLLQSNLSDLTDGYDAAQLVILAKKRGASDLLGRAMQNLQNNISSNESFAPAFNALVESRDPAAGLMNFDAWVNLQLDDEDKVDWYSLAGRYFAAAGQIEQARTCLTRATKLSATDHENYFLAWQELNRLRKSE